MAQSKATIQTESGSRNLQQLCKHWSHEMETEFTPERGRIVFPSGAIVALIAEAQSLVVMIDSDDVPGLPRLEQVVEDHIKRFAFREELVFSWNR